MGRPRTGAAPPLPRSHTDIEPRIIWYVWRLVAGGTGDLDGTPPTYPENLARWILVCHRYPTVFFEQKMAEYAGASRLRGLVSGITW
jgi:hypothetical protein